MKHISAFKIGADLFRGGVVWLLAIALLALTPLGSFAATTVKSYPFTGTSESWTGVVLAESTATYSANTLTTTIVGRNKSNAGIGWQLTGVTWEDLGVPPGDVVTAVDGAFDWQCSLYTVGASSSSGALTITDSADGNATTLETEVLFTATTALATRNASAAIAVPAAMQASNSLIKIKLLGTLATANDANATVTRVSDNVTLTITHAPPSPSNSYGTMTSMSGPLTANLSQQTVATVPVTPVNGGQSVSSYTVNLSGTVTAGDVAGVYVADGTNTWSATGSYGNGSSVVCSGANAIPGATLSIRVTLNATADAKTVAVTLQTDSNTAASLPKGPSNAIAISAPAGPSATITSCGDCHGNPPTDEATRNPATGGFVGDHQSHFNATSAIPAVSCSTCHTPQATYNHRNANINLASPIFGGSGSYSRTSTFPQSNSPTPGTCSNINCHYNTTTPQWGRATPIACNECHSLPPTPASDAHSKHYTAKAAQGWTTGTTTQCLVCHPDNTVHSNVTDGTLLVNGSLGFNGSTCSSTPTGCHNGKTTPAWNTTGITCSSCHVIAGGAAGDPVSGLHDTVNLTDHDDAFGTGGTCTSCHSATTPSTNHFDGTVQNSTSGYNWNTTNIPLGYSRALDSCAAAGTCHSDGGTWNRRWTWAKTNDVVWNYADNAASALVCGNCHGSFAAGWNIIGATDHVDPSLLNNSNPNTADDPDTLATSKASHGECSKCHAWGHTNYIGANNKHVNGTLEMNLTLDSSPGDGDCTKTCHSGQTLVMNAASGWTDASVIGDDVACGDCHNGGVTPSTASGAHDAHGATFTSVNANPASIALCVRCHGNDGTGATHNNGTLNWATNLTYSAARGFLNGTCSGTAGCHVSTATNAMWDSSNLTNCNQCHQNTADVNNWGWNGTAAGNISMISSTQYTAVGHGQATINGVAANKACMACHDLAQPHDTTATLTGSNPFRLQAAFTCNSIVAGCHTVTGLLGTHDQATAGSKYTWPFAAKCVDCHDPHGDGSNLAMIHSDLADKGSAANWVRNTPDAAIETMVFTNTTGIAADSYAEGATTFDGICQECHTLTTSMKDNLTANGANHTATTGCIGCHGHDVGFKASGCNGCHGGDNATIGNKNFWPGGAGATYPDRTGEHNIHIQKLATKLGYPFNDTLTDQQQKTMCAYCHPYTTDPGESGHYEGASGTAPADVTAAAFNPLWSTLDATPYPNQADTGTAAGYTGGNGTGGSCSGIDCHNDNPTPATHEWYDGATSTCVMCHTPGGSGRVPLASGLHKPGSLISSTPHDDSFGSGPATCTSNCHTTMGAVGGAASTHADGVNAGNTTAALGLAAGLYTQTLATGNGSGTCSGGGVSAAGCHGIDPGDAGTWARKWDDTISYAANGSTECAGCHGGFNETDWTFGMDTTAGDFTVSHNKDWNNDTVSNEIIGNHQNATSNATKCNICHVYGDTQYIWATHHRNRKISMNSMSGTNTYSDTAFTCSNTCHTEQDPHAMESSRNATWANRGEMVAGPALDCTGCHSTIYNAGAGTHIDADGPGTAFIPGTTAGTTLCQACHTQHAQASDTTAANKIIISTVGIATMTNSGGAALYPTHGNKIWLGGTATSNATYTTTINATTEAQMCWGCHDKVTQNYYTIAAGTSVTISGSTITSTGINTKFPVGSWVTIFDTGARPANQGRTFKVASVGTNTITVTVPTGEGALTAVSGATTITIVSPVSEWQVNENSSTGTLSYNYGMLFSNGTANQYVFSSDWTTATWRSGRGFNSGSAYNPAWYKRGLIQSTHTANVGGTFTAAISAGNSLGYNRTETKDAVANIRCSNCHDVHGTHDGVNGDVAGKPYLRGTWKGNPYPEDMAPQYGMSNWTIQGRYGVVPKASAATANSGLATVTKAGGYWIDQNSGDPNSGLTATATSGLCDQCHGATKDGAWTAAEIGAIDQTTESGLWISGYNGHANAVLTGSGANNGGTLTAGGAEIRGRNIFTRTMRGNASFTEAKANQLTLNMGAQGSGQGYSYRGTSSGYKWFPRVTTTSELEVPSTTRPLLFADFAWTTLTQDTTVGTEPAHDAQVKFHTFNCAKCHNPHASRLPKLMITNCLDTNHNTWEDKSTFTGTTALTGVWTGVRHSQYATAQNCHRLDARASLASGQVTTLGQGWNKVTPWLEVASPNATLGADPNP